MTITARIQDEISKALRPDSDRSWYIRKNFGSNHMNHPYPSGIIPISQPLPIDICTPFKYLTFGPEPNGDGELVMIVQKEGGISSWGEEMPCREVMVVMKLNEETGVFQECRSHAVEKELGCSYSDWVKVKDFSVSEAEALLNVSSRPYASSVEFLHSATYDLSGPFIVPKCIHFIGDSVHEREESE